MRSGTWARDTRRERWSSPSREEHRDRALVWAEHPGVGECRLRSECGRFQIRVHEPWVRRYRWPARQLGAPISAASDRDRDEVADGHRVAGLARNGDIRDV